VAAAPALAHDAHDFGTSGLPELEHAHENDEAHAAIARLRVAERQQRTFADEIAAVAGYDVPEIVHVAEPLAQAARALVVELGLRHEARFFEPTRRDVLGVHEARVLVTERSFG
jgi:2-methylaconitate cis-trans-isomerase PrpF